MHHESRRLTTTHLVKYGSHYGFNLIYKFELSKDCFYESFFFSYFIGLIATVQEGVHHFLHLLFDNYANSLSPYLEKH